VILKNSKKRLLWNKRKWRIYSPVNHWSSQIFLRWWARHPPWISSTCQLCSTCSLPKGMQEECHLHPAISITSMKQQTTLT